MDDVAIDFLRRLPLFADLPEADLRALHQKTLPMTLQTGAWLMREGEMADALWQVFVLVMADAHERVISE